MTPAELGDVLGREPSTAGIFLDFDGTLAPIVSDPAASRPAEGAIEAVRALAERFGRVALVSGRPVSFLEGWFAPDAAGVALSGLYGLEQVVDGVRSEHADAVRWRSVVAGAIADARTALPPTVLIEDKGLSLTVHSRTAPDTSPLAAAWADGVAAATGLERRGAKASIELHPPIAVDKGTVVAEVAAGLATVVYAGDDVGDLPAFAALDRLAADGVTTVKVAVDSPEAPDEVLGAADLVLSGPDEVVSVLGSLAGTPAP